MSMTRRFGHLLVLLTIGSGAVSQMVAQGQLPPGSIDGAVNPEQIPDAVAFRLFFGALAAPPTSAGPTVAGAIAGQSPSASLSQRAKLAPASLTEADIGVVLNALKAFSTSPATATNGMANQQQASSFDALGQNTINTLQAQMSGDGFRRLLAHVQAQKKFIKRVPYPIMVAPANQKGGGQ